MVNIESGEILVADKILEDFTEEQATFWTLFYSNHDVKKPIDLSAVNDSSLDPFRSNFWWGEFIFDEDGNICDLVMNYVGQNLANFYGQRRGENMITNYSENSFRTDFPTYHYRLKTLIDVIIEKKRPILTASQYVQDETIQITVRGLLIPVSRHGKGIDGIYGHAEVIVNK